MQTPFGSRGPGVSATGRLTRWAEFADIARNRFGAAMVEPDDSLPSLTPLADAREDATSEVRRPRPASSPRPDVAHSHRRASAGEHAARQASLDAAMDRYARGEPAAFDEVYRRGAPRVRGFLLRLCGQRALSDDLTQEVFLRVHRARGTFGPGAAALPWILTIARNAFLDHVRRARARPRTAAARTDGDETPEREAAPSGRGDETLAAREMLDVVRRTLAALPVMQREAFVLLRFEGLTVTEAAQVLGAREGAVKVRAFRAYEALRAALGDRRADGDEKP